MDHEEAKRKHIGGKVLGYFYWASDWMNISASSLIKLYIKHISLIYLLLGFLSLKNSESSPKKTPHNLPFWISSSEKVSSGTFPSSKNWWMISMTLVRGGSSRVSWVLKKARLLQTSFYSKCSLSGLWTLQESFQRNSDFLFHWNYCLKAFWQVW